jgi:hypothetical protein
MVFYNHKRLIDPRVFIIGFFPYPETTHLNEHTMQYHFRSLAVTYGLNVQVVHNPGGVMQLPDLPVICMEEPHAGTVDLQDFEHPKDAIYMVGNSKYQNLSKWFEADHLVSIKAPMHGQPLYGDQVAAIVMNDRAYRL